MIYNVQKKPWYAVSLALPLTLAVASSYFMAAAFGQGLGQDQAIPITIGDRRVAIEAIMKPSFMPISESSKPTLVIRAHDENNNATIPGIDYRIVVELKNETLLDQRFSASDGIVAANLVPDKEISGWEINNKPNPSERIEVSQKSPIQLRSKILSDGGLYHLVVTLEKTSRGISLQSDPTFDVYISVGKTYTFEAETHEGKKELLVKTYYDEIMNLDYSNKTISFETPFNWERRYVSQVPVLHIEVQFPKSFQELRANSYHGTMNGKDLEFQSVVIDDYSSEQNRIVHIILSNNMLTRFAETMNDRDVAAFTLQPLENKPKFPLDVTSLPAEKFVFELAWGPDIIETGTPITFIMNMQDAKAGGLVRGASFDFVLTQNGTELYREHMSSNIGTYTTQYTFSKAGTVTLAASNIKGQGESSKIDLIVLQGSGNNTQGQQQQAQKSGCLIATAAFGSELTPQVQYLRYFRDHYIMSTASGSAFMNTFNSIYYSFSPQVADYEREQPWLQVSVKAALYPLFGILMIAEGAYSIVEGEIGSILAGAVASSLIGALYLWPVGFLASRRVDNKLLIIIVGTGVAFLAATLIAYPAMLPLSTTAFVMTAAGASAIATSKAAKYFSHQLAHASSVAVKANWNSR